MSELEHETTDGAVFTLGAIDGLKVMSERIEPKLGEPKNIQDGNIVNPNNS